MSEYDLLVHVDDNDPKRLELALTNVANYTAALPGEDFQVALVVNGPGVQLLTGSQEALARTGAELMEKGLTVKACRNALRKFGIGEDELWPGIQVVPAGIVEIVKLQRSGFVYLRP
ncbi:DsrE family protein [uncultured Mailhella sp.]|uniref:DsrE family protein n=1 Tax=uncultured Mailhella sp. TaxID=1981031 RepID=UPI00260CF4B7|nr:DsrE family protein [uncultured Mailhella sp.]